MEEQCFICKKWLKDDEIYLNIPHTDIHYCKPCYFHDRPERLKRSDTNSREALKNNPFIRDSRECYME